MQRPARAVRMLAEIIGVELRKGVKGIARAVLAHWGLILRFGPRANQLRALSTLVLARTRRAAAPSKPSRAV